MMTTMQAAAPYAIRGLWLWLVVGALVSFTARAEADLAGAAGLVRNTTDELLAAVASDRSLVDSDPAHALKLVTRIVAPHVDMQRSARRVLGKHWKRATAQQRDRFVKEFRVLLLRTYASAIADSPDIKDVKYAEPRLKRKHEAIVPTRVPGTSGSDVSIHYRLHNRDGAWKLYDVSIEGISLLVTYKNTFRSIIKRDGMEALLTSMETRNQR